MLPENGRNIYIQQINISVSWPLKHSKSETTPAGPYRIEHQWSTAVNISLANLTFSLFVCLFVLLPTGWWIWKILLRILNWIISTFTSKTWPFQDFFPSWVPYQIETHLQFTRFLNTNSMDYFNTDLFCFPVVSEIPVWSPQLDTFSPYHLKWWVSKYFILRVVIITSPKYSQKSCEVDSIIIFPILQKCELRLRDSKSFPQGHSAGKWKRQTLNSGILSS